MSRWLRKLGDGGGPPIVVLPYAGGGSVAYRPFAQAMAKDATVWAVVPPGRETRLGEAPIADWRAWLDEAAAALAPLFEGPERPVMWGHSLGGLTAFELARRLPPKRLIVSASRPPGHPDWQELAGLDDERLIARLKRLGGTPQAVLDEPELMRLVLPTLHADFSMAGSHRPAPGALPGVPLTALCGLDDYVASPATMGGWAAWTTGPFTLALFEGGHFFPFDPATAAPAREAIARLLADG